MSKTEITDNANNVTITLDGDRGDIIAGGNGQVGDLIVKNAFENEICHIRQLATLGPGKTGCVIEIKNSDGKELMQLGERQQGFIGIRNSVGEVTIDLDGGSGSIRLISDGKPRVRISHANALLGGNGTDGDLVLFPGDGDNSTLAQANIHLDAGRSNIWVGGHGTGGDLVLLPSGATDISDQAKATILLIGESGEIHLRNGDKTRIRLDGTKGDAWLGGNGANGDLALFSEAGDNSTLDQATIYLDGQRGDINLKNADCAEEFDIAESAQVEPGTVMVLDQEGDLQQSKEPYDKKVAGVISGAGDYKPGIVLDKKHSENRRMPVALVGKVYCKVDAQYSPIEVGDLLTTSPTAGHAMKTNDPLKAFGAVIGKALRPLKGGAGLIPILIALQ